MSWSDRVAPPTPEVQYLPTLIRRVRAGDLRIPAFQRSFVWEDRQVLDLLESVYLGFPIGSLLFWRVEKAVLRESEDARVPLPRSSPPSFPAHFVLDGLQRLSTLFGVLEPDHPARPAEFDVVFDLRAEQFWNRRDATTDDPLVPMSTLFSPRELLKVQSLLETGPDPEEMIDRSIKLQSIFQEYMIPTVTITRTEVSEVVEIFERINSKGTALHTVDFMRALTWSEAFDLNDGLAKVSQPFEETGFDFPPETLIKIVAIVAGKDPSSDAMLTLRNASAGELHEAVAKARDVLVRTVAFLEERFCVHSTDFVPYEGQLLVVTALFAESMEPPPAVLDTLERWYWSISFTEGLRGKPDHYVSRYIGQMKRLLTGNGDGPLVQKEVGLDDLGSRPFKRGAALSAATASMLARTQPLSLATGEPISPRRFMSALGRQHFSPFVPIELLRQAENETQRTARLISNIVVDLDASDVGVWPRARAFLEGIEPEERNAILRSQLLPESTVELLTNADVRSFLRARAELLEVRIRELVSGK